MIIPNSGLNPFVQRKVAPTLAKGSPLGEFIGDKTCTSAEDQVVSRHTYG